MRYYEIIEKLEKGNEEQFLLTSLQSNRHKSGQIALASTTLLPRNTLLVHFTFSQDAFDAIQKQGFQKGEPRIDALAVTMMHQNTGVGYNFAFLANGSDAKAFAASSRFCVFFRHSGVFIDHLGDNEKQVVFWGPSMTSQVVGFQRDVKPGIHWMDSPWVGANQIASSFTQMSKIAASVI